MLTIALAPPGFSMAKGIRIFLSQLRLVIHRSNTINIHHEELHNIGEIDPVDSCSRSEPKPSGMPQPPESKYDCAPTKIPVEGAQ
jgi:hypothetical protein